MRYSKGKTHSFCTELYGPSFMASVIQDKGPECRGLLDRIELDMDMALDGLQHYKGVKFSQNYRKAPEYKQSFNETEMKIYEVMAGRPYPK